MIKVGDTILWSNDIYFIKDIDEDKPINQILFSFLNSSMEVWHSDVATVNELIEEGVIVIVKRDNDFSPIKYVKPFTLNGYLFI